MALLSGVHPLTVVAINYAETPKAGAGNNIVNGNQFETFTIHGWGYGLLAADLVEPFLLAYFALSSHGTVLFSL
jgi:hypothetical protein